MSLGNGSKGYLSMPSEQAGDGGKGHFATAKSGKLRMRNQEYQVLPELQRYWLTL